MQRRHALLKHLDLLVQSRRGQIAVAAGIVQAVRPGRVAFRLRLLLARRARDRRVGARALPLRRRLAFSRSFAFFRLCLRGGAFAVLGLVEQGVRREHRRRGFLAELGVAAPSKLHHVLRDERVGTKGSGTLAIGFGFVRFIVRAVVVLCLRRGALHVGARLGIFRLRVLRLGLGLLDASEHALVPLDVTAHLLHAELEPAALPLDVAPVLLPPGVQGGRLGLAPSRILARLVPGLLVTLASLRGPVLLGKVPGGALPRKRGLVPGAALGIRRAGRPRVGSVLGRSRRALRVLALLDAAVHCLARVREAAPPADPVRENVRPSGLLVLLRLLGQRRGVRHRARRAPRAASDALPRPSEISKKSAIRRAEITEAGLPRAEAGARPDRNAPFARGSVSPRGNAGARSRDPRVRDWRAAKAWGLGTHFRGALLRRQHTRVRAASIDSSSTLREFSRPLTGGKTSPKTRRAEARGTRRLGTQDPARPGRRSAVLSTRASWRVRVRLRCPRGWSAEAGEGREDSPPVRSV